MKSPSATRIPQHKERREETKGKEISAIKKENSSLRRQVARLTKQLSKMSHLVEESEERENVAKQQKISPEKQKCDKCGSVDLGTLKLPSGTVFVSCKTCGTRKKV